MPDKSPRLAFATLEEHPWIEVKAQMHGDRRVSVWEKWVEFTPERLCLYAKYDPGFITQRHGHMSDHIVFVLEGEIAVGDRRCPQGTHITLEKGATFGPIVGGPQGAVLYEIMMGDPRSAPADKEEFYRVCRERGVTPLPNPPIDPKLIPAFFGPRTD